MKTEDRRKLGKKTRAQGKAFEKLVREDLIKTGWIVTRWDNNIELVCSINEEGKERIEKGKLVQSKAKFNPFTKQVMNMSSGFPDFLAITYGESNASINNFLSGINARILVESKINNSLDKLEKQKMEWIERELNIPCYVAYPEKIGRKTCVKLRRWNE